MNKSYIWSLPTRIFHWSLVIFIIIAFLSDDDDLIKYHALAGYSIFILLLFRFSWGFIGPKYSKFSEFNFSFSAIKEFLKNLKSNKVSEYIGHNPLASLVMFSILVIILLIIVSGVLTYGQKEGESFMAFLKEAMPYKTKIFKKIHEFFANFLIFLIVLHLLGVAIDTLKHKDTKTLNSIFTGFKSTKIQESIKLNTLQKIFSIFCFVFLIVFILYCIIYPSNFIIGY